MRNLLAALSLLTAAAFGAPQTALAQTATVTQGMPATFTYTFNGFNGLGVLPGVSAKLDLSFVSAVADGSHGGIDYNFTYTLSNTSTVASRVSIFGFNTSIDPVLGAPNASFASGLFDNVADGNVPNGLGSRDACVSKGNNCAGGGNGGVANGAQGGGSFTLSFASVFTSLTLNDFFVRYQSLPDALGGSASGTVVAVPAPIAGAGAYALIGLTVLYFARRRGREALSV